MADNSDLAQILQTHTAYAAMLGRLIHTLVEQGAISAESGSEVVQFGARSLRSGPTQGELVLQALQSFEEMARTIRLANVPR